MNIIQKLFNRKQGSIILQNGKGFLDSSLASGDQGAMTLDTPTPGNFGSLDGYLEAYADSTWIYACVSRKAQDAAALPLKLYRRKGRDTEEVENHAAIEVLSYINEHMTAYDYWEYVFSSLELTGNAYSWIIEHKGTLPASLLPLIPSLIEPVPSSDAKKLIEGYRYHVNNSSKHIDAEEMHHTRYYNPLKSGYVIGISPLTSARMAYETGKRLARWNLNQIKNGNSMRGALKTDNPYFNDKDKRAEAMDSWRNRFKGEEGESIGVLYGGLDFKEFGVSQQDMDFLNQHKMTREDILGVYKVPPAVLGLFEYANYANAEQQEKFYWRNGMLPMLRKVESSYNEKFLPKFGKEKGLFLAFDTSKIDVLQENEDAKSQVAKRYFDMGVPYNRVAEALKLPIQKIEGGEIGYLPFSLMPISEAGKPAAPAAPADKPEKRLKMTETQKVAKWKAFVKIADRHEERVKLTVQNYFKWQESEVQVNLDDQKNLKKKVIVEDILFDPKEASKKLATAMKPNYLEIIKDQAAQEIANFNFGISFDLNNPRVTAWIEQHGGSAIENINNTTLDELRATLTEGVDSGESIPDLAKRITEVYDRAIGARSNNIARTETIGASNEGALEAYRQTGLKIKKGWLSAGDERTRETHIAAGKQYDDNGAISLSDDFQVGAGSGAAPGQIGLPEEDCQCRCSIYPVVEE